MKKRGLFSKICEKQSIKDVVDALVVPKYPGLDVFKFSLALGIFSALSVLFISFFVWQVDSGYTLIKIIAEFYIGYDLTPFGMILGSLYGFVDGFLCGWIFSKIYNFLLRW